MAYRNYGPANGFIVAKDGNGDFTTIGAALTAATSGQTIFVRPGTYTENPTLKAGVNITGFTGDGFQGNVVISGTIAASYNGTVTLSGLTLQTNSAAALNITSTNTSTLNLINCTISASNSTAITANAANFVVDFYNCISASGANNLIFAITTISAFSFMQSDLSAGTGANTIATGVLNFYQCFMGTFAVTTSSTGAINTFNCYWDNPANMTCITMAGTGGALFENTSFASGTASAISIGTGCNATIAGCQISSSNTNTITGAGTINIGTTIFISSSSGVNVSTVNGLPLPANQGGTGVANGAGSTITLGGALTTSGAFASTFTMTGATSVTFPTSGTLATSSSIPTLPLSLANGGTNANLTANNGGIFYSTGSAGAILAGTATAGQLLTSGASTTPSWTASTYPSTNAVSTLLYASSANVMAALATANDGVLVTSNSGVPSWLANSSTAGFVLTANTSAPPSWQASGGAPSTGTSFTPTCVGATTAGSTTYTTQVGRYIQIGALVVYTFSIEGTWGSTASGNVTISLPVSATSTSSLTQLGTGYLETSPTYVLGAYEILAGTNTVMNFGAIVANSWTLSTVTSSTAFKCHGSISYLTA
jgi:hypothetical protein